MLAVVPATLFRHGLEDLRGGAPPLLRGLAHVASVQLAPGLGQEVPAVITVLLGSHGGMVWERSRRCQTDTVPTLSENRCRNARLPAMQSFYAASQLC